MLRRNGNNWDKWRALSLPCKACRSIEHSLIIMLVQLMALTFLFWKCTIIIIRGVSSNKIMYYFLKFSLKKKYMEETLILFERFSFCCFELLGLHVDFCQEVSSFFIQSNLLVSSSPCVCVWNSSFPSCRVLCCSLAVDNATNLLLSQRLPIDRSIFCLF